MKDANIEEVLKAYHSAYNNEWMGNIQAVKAIQVRNSKSPLRTDDAWAERIAYQRVAIKVYTGLILATLQDIGVTKLNVFGTNSEIGWLPDDHIPGPSISRLHFCIVNIPNLGHMVIDLGGVYGGVELTVSSLNTSFQLTFSMEQPGVRMWQLCDVKSMRLHGQPPILRESLVKDPDQGSPSLDTREASLKHFHDKVDEAVKVYLNKAPLNPVVKDSLTRVFAPVQEQSFLLNLNSIQRSAVSVRGENNRSTDNRVSQPVSASSSQHADQSIMESSRSQSARVDPLYVQIFEGTKNNLDDALYDLHTVINNRDERLSIMRRAMGPESTFEDVSDIDIRLALRQLNALWNNTGDVVITSHRYNVNAEIDSQRLIDYTKSAVRTIIEDQILPAAMSENTSPVTTMPSLSAPNAPSTSTQTTVMADMPALNAQLFDAVRNNNVTDIQLLIAAGANPNATNSRGWTPLYAACRSLKQEAVMALLVNPAVDVNLATYRSGTTPLMVALDMSCHDYFQHSNIIDQLLLRNADVHRTDSEGKNALAIMAERLDEMRRMNWSDSRLETKAIDYEQRLHTLMQTTQPKSTDRPTQSAGVPTSFNYMLDLTSRVTRFQPQSSTSTVGQSVIGAGSNQPQGQPVSSLASVSSRFFTQPEASTMNPEYEAFFYAVLTHNLVDIENMLTNNPSLILIRNPGGDSALSLTMSLYFQVPQEEKPDFMAVIQLLLSKDGIDLSQENNEGVRPLDMAISNGDEELTALLLDKIPPAP